MMSTLPPIMLPVVCHMDHFLDPYIFLYVNDIANVFPTLTPILFADDTNIILEGNVICGGITKMNTEIVRIMDWIYANKLSLNTDKTIYMIFHTKERKYIIKC